MILTLAFVIAVATQAVASEYSFIASDIPPYAYKNDGTASGILISAIETISQHADFPFNRDKILFLPWPRVMHQGLNAKKTIVVGMVRTPEREKYFQWVGPLFKARLGLIALADSHVADYDFSRLEHYTIATHRDSAPESALFATGYPSSKAIRLADIEQAFQMLERGRVDFLSYLEDFKYVLPKGVESTPDHFRFVHPLNEVHFYIALSKDIAPGIVRRLQQSLDALKTRDESGVSPYSRLDSDHSD